ncbi:MAG: undecaprenyl diphosphate synthase family protein [Alistipes sp.]|nr:undecaprenyl diphosphate synthase family protein [Alistipes sp.]
MSTRANIPQHVAIIMDGNGRWAKLRGKERCEGLVAGLVALRRTIHNSAEEGVKYVTV